MADAPHRHRAAAAVPIVAHILGTMFDPKSSILRSPAHISDLGLPREPQRGQKCEKMYLGQGNEKVMKWEPPEPEQVMVCVSKT